MTDLVYLVSPLPRAGWRWGVYHRGLMVRSGQTVSRFGSHLQARNALSRYRQATMMEG